MLRQHYAEQSDAPTVLGSPVTEPARRSLPHWQVVARHWFGVVLERVVGEYWPKPRTAVLVFAVIVALFVVIGLTLSVGNAVLVAVVAIVMRFVCEHRPVRR